MNSSPNRPTTRKTAAGAASKASSRPSIGMGGAPLRRGPAPSSAAAAANGIEGEEDSSMLLDTSIDLLDVSHDLDLNNLTLEHIHLGNDGESNKRKPAASKKTAGAKPRPSWGPPSSAISSDAKKQGGKMRLLQGLQDDWEGAAQPTNSSNSSSATTTTRRGLGGMMDADPSGAGAGASTGAGRSAKPRFSLFAKPAFPAVPSTTASGASESAAASGPRDSAGENAQGSSSASSAPGAATVGSNAQRAMEDAPPTQEGRGESKEAVAKQLAELRMMNETFESYERMLGGATEQIDVFAERIDDTNKLLDIYIDLLRQAEKTQTLLTDPEWKGATEDANAHAQALEQAAAETARLQAEAAEAARQAEMARQEAIARAQAQARAAAASSATGGSARGGAARGRGAAVRGRGVVRGRGAPAASTASTRGTARTATTAPSNTATNSGIARAARPSTRGATSGIARGRTTSSGTGASARPSAVPGTATGASRTSSAGSGAYANVRSSGYGPAR